MSLVVEDGTGRPDADAFASREHVTAYHALRGNADWADPSHTDEDRDAAIRRATFFLSDGYPWLGLRRWGRQQRLAWPRLDVRDAEGWDVPANVVPREVQDATAEVALRELLFPRSMAPEVVFADRVKRERVEGAVEVEYELSDSAEDSRPRLLVVDQLLASLVGARGGASLSGISCRI